MSESFVSPLNQFLFSVRILTFFVFLLGWPNFLWSFLCKGLNFCLAFGVSKFVLLFLGGGGLNLFWPFLLRRGSFLFWSYFWSFKIFGGAKIFHFFWGGTIFFVKPRPQTLSPKTPKPKTKGPWAYTKISWATTTSTTTP